MICGIMGVGLVFPYRRTGFRLLMSTANFAFLDLTRFKDLRKSCYQSLNTFIPVLLVGLWWASTTMKMPLSLVFADSRRINRGVTKILRFNGWRLLARSFYACFSGHIFERWFDIGLFVSILVHATSSKKISNAHFSDASSSCYLLPARSLSTASPSSVSWSHA